MKMIKRLVAVLGFVVVLAPAVASACPEMDGEKPRPVAVETLQANLKLNKTDGKSPARVEAALRRLRGVHRIEVQVKNKRATVRYNPRLVRPADLIAALREAGLQAWVEA